MRRTRKTVKSEEEMYTLAASFVNALKAKSHKLKAATIIGLTGELGTGKTTFVKGVARALGVREIVTSPTFVIMKIYKLPKRRVSGSTSNFPAFAPASAFAGASADKSAGKQLPASSPWRHLVHIDTYRLESPEELRALGWDEIARDPANLIMIEWVEKVRLLLPRGYCAISFKCTDESTRRVLL